MAEDYLNYLLCFWKWRIIYPSRVPLFLLWDALFGICQETAASPSAVPTDNPPTPRAPVRVSRDCKSVPFPNLRVRQDPVWRGWVIFSCLFSRFVLLSTNSSLLAVSSVLCLASPFHSTSTTHDNFKLSPQLLSGSHLMEGRLSSSTLIFVSSAK